MADLRVLECLLLSEVFEGVGIIACIVAARSDDGGEKGRELIVRVADKTYRKATKGKLFLTLLLAGVLDKGRGP
jgi:hypothetical protein